MSNQQCPGVSTEPKKHNFQPWGFDGFVFTDRCVHCNWWSFDRRELIFKDYDELKKYEGECIDIANKKVAEKR
jgi:hypothetical protein